MITLLATLNMFLALSLLYFLYRRILQEGLCISTAALLVIVLTNVIGLSPMPVVLAEEMLNTGNVMLPFNPDAYTRQVLSAAIFLVASLWFLYVPPLRLRLLSHPGMVRQSPMLTCIAGVAVFLVGLGLWTKYMVFGGGLDLALSTKYGQFSFDLASAHRAEAQVQLGQGYYSALVASFSVFPLSVAVLRLLGRRDIRFLAAWLLGLVLSLLFAVSLRQKGPPVMLMLCYGGVMLAGGTGSLQIWQRLTRRMKWSLLLVGISVVFLGCGLFYLVSEGESFVVSVQKAVARVIITPCASAHLWYIVFPSQFPFRGVLDVFFVQSPFSVGSPAVTIQDVAVASIGAACAANASFLAVSWSGLGYLGVAFATATLLLILGLMDNLTAFLPVLPRMLVFCLLVPAFMVLTSNALLDAILIGTLPAVVAFAVLLRVRT